ncbi:iron-sulfur cluster insertion protein ErpA [Pseudomaricurvus sp. HS19]|uniref:iron-sulfur cluster insertion protein ErpA n=1 Tax=Pseudomaricurvus sp. HS19 TaxID=2692626 RepID=UPI00136E79D2|nr:iron-sulfur cluster insertion protein ErpA [Pseudomaricurvus sp. HS19]MYM63263.1 iron-sulfur cluster insertion protein ErpA [Pseudomaricurvus sp. HS19]
MSTAEIFTPQAVLVTDNAVAKVKSLIEEEANEELKLRVFVTGGGCSGFQYGFTFDELVADDDAVIERGGITVLVDSMSYPYIAGSEVDYQEGLQGSRFVIQNPNASSTCGCGASFAV